MRLREGIDSALWGTGLPYGYTATFWGSGAALINQHGAPNVGQILLLVAGAAAAYGILRLMTHGAASDPNLQLSATPSRIRAGALHVSAMMLAIGSAALIALISSGVAWPLAGFAFTFVYVIVTSIEMAMVEHRRG